MDAGWWRPRPGARTGTAPRTCCWSRCRWPRAACACAPPCPPARSRPPSPRSRPWASLESRSPPPLSPWAGGSRVRRTSRTKSSARTPASARSPPTSVGAAAAMWPRWCPCSAAATAACPREWIRRWRRPSATPRQPLSQLSAPPPCSTAASHPRWRARPPHRAALPLHPPLPPPPRPRPPHRTLTRSRPRRTTRLCWQSPSRT
mmetsp:Transcript_23147/g.87612  ORF Transcript_23147/g.87612 Transcript_23147/m.87612 type:complete len:204 (-) Transcript_23147:1580-2191(-)